MARYRIETPVRGATTDLGNVHFHQGVAEVDEVPHWLRSYCEQNGYPITDNQPPVDEDQADGVEDDDQNPVTPPPANAKLSVWREHAVAVGGDPDTVNKMTRDELAAQFGSQEGAQA
jgi:hypothetical protein